MIELASALEISMRLFAEFFVYDTQLQRFSMECEAKISWVSISLQTQTEESVQLACLVSVETGQCSTTAAITNVIFTIVLWTLDRELLLIFDSLYK